MGEDIVITYETLFDILRREKNREDLQELDPEFLQQVSTYLKEKQEMLHAQGFADRQENLRIQIANTRKIIKELYDRRERKVVNLALYQSRAQGSLLSTKAFLPFERAFFETFLKLLQSTRELALDTTLDEVPRKPVPATELHTMQQKNKDAYPEPKLSSVQPTSMQQPVTKLVRFVHAVPKFLGPELEIYGPFAEDDVASLPLQIADILIEKRRAEAMIRNVATSSIAQKAL